MTHSFARTGYVALFVSLAACSVHTPSALGTSEEPEGSVAAAPPAPGSSSTGGDVSRPGQSSEDSDPNSSEGASCAKGEATCGGACTAVTSDAANCGACGQACGGACVAGLCGGPSSVQVSEANRDVTVSWTAPAGGAAVVGYRVTSVPATVTKTTEGTTSVTFEHLAGGSYTFTVTPITALGDGEPATSSALAFCYNVSRSLVASTIIGIGYGEDSRVAVNDERLSAYRSGLAEITGWMGFDLDAAGIPASASVVSLGLRAAVISSFDSPKDSPSVAVAYSELRNWSKDSITSADAFPKTASLVPGKTITTPGAKDFAIPADVRDWTADVEAGWLTLGFSNEKPGYS